MVKEINKDAIMIKELLKKGLRQLGIARLLNLKKEKVSYWVEQKLNLLNSKRKSLKMFISKQYKNGLQIKLQAL